MALKTPVIGLNGVRQRVLEDIDAWLALDDRPIIEVPVPEFARPGPDGKLPPANEWPIVLMQAMDARERDEWELRFIGDWNVEPDQEKANARVRQVKVRDRIAGFKSELLVHCVVNSAGEKIFSKQHIALLQARNAAAINRLADKAQEICGFTTSDVESLTKNSPAPPDDASPSD